MRVAIVSPNTRYKTATWFGKLVAPEPIKSPGTSHIRGLLIHLILSSHTLRSSLREGLLSFPNRIIGDLLGNALTNELLEYYYKRSFLLNKNRLLGDFFMGS